MSCFSGPLAHRGYLGVGCCYLHEWGWGVVDKELVETHLLLSPRIGASESPSPGMQRSRACWAGLLAFLWSGQASSWPGPPVSSVPVKWLWGQPPHSRPSLSFSRGC